MLRSLECALYVSGRVTVTWWPPLAEVLTSREAEPAGDSVYVGSLSESCRVEVVPAGYASSYSRSEVEEEKNERKNKRSMYTL